MGCKRTELDNLNTTSSLLQFVVKVGLVSADALDKLPTKRKESNARLARILVERGLVSGPKLAQVLSYQLCLPWVSLEYVRFSPKLLKLIPYKLALEYGVVPVHERRRPSDGKLVLYVASDDPTNEAAVKACEKASGLPVRMMVATPNDISTTIGEAYEQHESTSPQVDEPLVDAPSQDQSGPCVANSNFGLTSDHRAGHTAPMGELAQDQRGRPAPKKQGNRVTKVPLAVDSETSSLAVSDVGGFQTEPAWTKDSRLAAVPIGQRSQKQGKIRTDDKEVSPSAPSVAARKPPPPPSLRGSSPNRKADPARTSSPNRTLSGRPVPPPPPRITSPNLLAKAQQAQDVISRRVSAPAVTGSSTPSPPPPPTTTPSSSTPPPPRAALRSWQNLATRDGVRSAATPPKIISMDDNDVLEELDEIEEDDLQETTQIPSVLHHLSNLKPNVVAAWPSPLVKQSTSCRDQAPLGSSINLNEEARCLQPPLPPPPTLTPAATPLRDEARNNDVPIDVEPTERESHPIAPIERASASPPATLPLPPPPPPEPEVEKVEEEYDNHEDSIDVRCFANDNSSPEPLTEQNASLASTNDSEPAELAETSSSTQTNTLLVVGADDAFVSRCKELMSHAQTHVVRCTLMTACARAHDMHPFAIVVPNDIYDFPHRIRKIQTSSIGSALHSHCRRGFCASFIRFLYRPF